MHPAHEAVLAARSGQEKAADGITRFVGSMWFVYLSAVAFALWMILVEGSPWATLTLVVSLEAIFLSTFVMVSQNRQATLAAAKAARDYEVTEKLLAEIHDLTAEIHKTVCPLGGSHV